MVEMPEAAGSSASATEVASSISCGPSTGASGIFGSSLLTNCSSRPRSVERSWSMSAPSRKRVSTEKAPARSAAAITMRPAGYHSVAVAVVRLSEAR